MIFTSNSKRVIIPFLFLLILIFSVSVNALDYDHAGYNGNVQGTGLFNQALGVYETGIKTVSDSAQTPLLHDLDNDGNKEIIVWDGVSLKLYKDRYLTHIDTYTTDFTSNDYLSNTILYDIDNDNYTEIIVGSQQNAKLMIIEYDGTTIHLQKELNFTVLDYFEGEIMLKCADIQKCALIYTPRVEPFSGVTGYLYSASFNSTSFIDIDHVLNTGSNYGYCFPKILDFYAGDIDNIDDDEIVVAYVRGQATTSNTKYYIQVIDFADDGTFSNDWTTESVTFSRTWGTSTPCDVNNIGNEISAPLVANIDGGVSNGKEVIVASMVNSNEYKMYSYNANGGFLDDYPEIQQSDGRLLSNPFLANAFTDTGYTDFCVTGYDDVDQQLDVTCGSELTGGIETVEFVYDSAYVYNISDSLTDYNIISHSANHNVNFEDGNDLSEVVTSYGIMEFEYDNSVLCLTSNICPLNRLYENVKGDGVVLSLDVENNGLDDLVVYTSTNLYYLDDNFINSPSVIETVSTDPCFSEIWEVGTEVDIRATVTDSNNDLVSAKAILYEGFTIETDIEQFEYLNVNYDFTDQDTSPQGMFFDGVNWFIIGDQTDSIYIYNKDFVYINQSYSIAAHTNQPRDLHKVDNFWYIVDDQQNDILKFDLAFNLNTTYSISSLGNDPKGIFYHEDFFYLIMDNTDTVYKLTKDMVYTGFFYYVGLEDTSPRDLYNNEGNWIILGDATDHLYKYNSDFIFVDETFDLSDQTVTPTSLYKDPSFLDNSFHVLSSTGIAYEYSSVATFVEGYDLGWIRNLSTGTTFSWLGTADIPSAKANLQIISQDSGSGEYTTLNIPFTVSSTGDSRGDSICSVEPVEIVEDQVIDGYVLGVNDSITTGITSVEETTGLALGKTIIWLIIMIFGTYFIWTGGSQSNPAITLGVIIIFNILMLIIGVILTYIPVFYILMLLVIFALFGAFYIRKIAVGGN